MQLDGKTVVLTGAQGGIGKCLHASLLAAGATVIAIGRRVEADVAGSMVVDLANQQQVLELCQQLKEKPVDILINLAGMMYFGHCAAQSPEHLEAMIRVNLTTPIQLTQSVVPHMLAQGSGKIVNVGSIFGALAFPHFAVYSATKAGLKGFSEAIRREYKGQGVGVTHIAPRAVDTAFNHGAIAELHKRTQTQSDSAEQVASIIQQAIIDDRSNVDIGFPERFFVRLNALIPSVIDKALVAKRDIANILLEEYTS
jgi:short-subunit dehydrogenase